MHSSQRVEIEVIPNGFEEATHPSVASDIRITDPEAFGSPGYSDEEEPLFLHASVNVLFFDPTPG